MEYGIMFDFEKICAPVILQIGDERREYADGKAASAVKFPEPYLVEKIGAEDNKVVVYDVNNTKMNDTSWTDKNVSLFDGD